MVEDSISLSKSLRQCRWLNSRLCNWVGTPLPLGFIGEMGSGKIRRIVNDSSAATETYLAHQLPDMAAAITTPICMIVMLFLFDWRFGLVSLLPIVLGFASMFILGYALKQ